MCFLLTDIMRIVINNFNELNPLDDDFRLSFCFILEDEINLQSESYENEIKKAFSDWITNVQEEDTLNAPKVNLLNLDKQAIFFSFNYTNTLTKLYDIEKSNILHLHNDVENFKDDVIFGHNIEPEKIPDFDEDGESMRSMFTDSENAARSLLFIFKKPVNEIINKYISYQYCPKSC